MGPLIAAALLTLILVGLAWKPGLAITLLGLVVVGLGILPRIDAPPLPELDSFKAVLGIGSNPPVIAGLFIIGFGRLVGFVQTIASRKQQIVVPDERPLVARRETAHRQEDRR